MGIRMQQVMLRSMDEFSCTWVRYHEDFFAWFAHRLCMHLNIGIGALILTCNPKKPFFPSYSFFLLLSLFFSSHFDSVAFFLSAAFCFQKGKSRVVIPDTDQVTPYSVSNSTSGVRSIQSTYCRILYSEDRS